MFNSDIKEEDILNKLNKEQAQSVLNFTTSTRIIAGPGTGKTTTIIAKILYLIFIKKIHPKRILVITFTNKAKEEIVQRIKKFSSDEKMIPMIFTYHSFASFFLRIEYSNLEQNSDFKIFDYSEQIRIVKNVIKDDPELKGISPNEFLTNLDALKNNTAPTKTNTYNGKKVVLYKRYSEYKKHHNALDFDDLLYEVDRILDNYPEVAERWKSRFDYLFVDEFQDTNNLQFDILRGITTPKSNITIVGDPDQNLYSWRGANIDLILNFPEYFEDVKTIVLSQNYRSTPTILNIAKRAISPNKNRIVNDLFSFNEEINNFTPKAYEFNSAQTEANFVASEVRRLIDKKHFSPNEIAIIYRSNYLSQEFESAFISNDIYYKVIGGFKFFDRKEVKEAIYLVGFLFLNDNYYFEMTIATPPKGLGEKTLQKIMEHSRENNLPYFESYKELVKSPKAIEYIELIEKYRKKLQDHDFVSLKDLINDYFKDLGFYLFYETEESRIENIHETIVEINKQIQFDNIRESFTIFVQRVSLLSSADETNNGNLVTLITAHSAKGTEYDVVFVVGLVEGIFPTTASIMSGSREKQEEERRSLYVAITRARKLLYFTYSKGFDFNNRVKLPSSFLKDLKLEVVKPYNTFNKAPNRNTFSASRETENSKEDYFKDNSGITAGSVIHHIDYGKGVVIEDLNQYIKVAFDKKNGLKILIKNNKAIERYEK